MKAPSAEVLSRPLSDIETAMLRPMRYVPDATAFGGVVPALVRGVSEADLRAACARVGEARPLARASVVWEGEQAFLKTIPGSTVPLEVLAPCGPHDLSRVVERTLAAATPVKPLLSVVFAPVRDTDTAWIAAHVHHAFFDYAGAVDMLHAILASTGEAPLEPVHELSRALSDFLPPEAFGAAFPRAQEILARGLIQTAAVPATPRVEPAEHAPSAFVCHAALSAEDAARIAAHARGEGANLTSAIAAAFVMATSRELRRSDDVVVQLPIGLHPFLGSDVRHKGGSYASVVFAKLDPRLAFWETARAIRAELTETTRSLPNALAPLVALGQSVESLVAAGKPPTIAPPDFTLQSCGRLTVPARVGKAEILRIPAVSYCEDAERTVAAHSFEGRLELSASTKDFAYSRANLVSWLNDGIVTLLAACEIDA